MTELKIKPSDKCYQLLKHLEGCKLKAYKCSAGRWTIGYGQTYYEDSRQVKQGDVITQQQADNGLPVILATFAISVYQALKVDVKQYQFDALCVLAYNIGISAFEKSSVLRTINKGGSKEDIEKWWMAWNKETKNGAKVVSKGLTNRRKSEYHLYSTGEIKYFF